MTQFASDSFTGTADTELSAYSASWVKVTGFDGSAKISAVGRVYPSDFAFFKSYRHTTTAPSADYAVSADAVVITKASSTGVGLVARAASSANTKYYLRVYTADNSVRIFKNVNGTTTQLASVSRAFATATTYPIRFEVEGTALRSYINNEGSPVASATDASISAAGHAGIFLSLAGSTETTGAHLDNFSADTFGASAPTLGTPEIFSVTSSGFRVAVGLS